MSHEKFINKVEQTYGVALPDRLRDYYTNDTWETYQDKQVAGLPGWDPNERLDIDLSPDAVGNLMDWHADWIERESREDGCAYSPICQIVDETDFFVTDLKDPRSAVLFGNHETGTFQSFSSSLDDFLQALVGDADMNPGDLFTQRFAKADDAYYDDEPEQVVELLAYLLTDNSLDPALPSPYMQAIPAAVNLLACAFVELEEYAKADEAFAHACRGIFCRDAFLNRARLAIMQSEYTSALDLCTQGLERFGDDDYAQTFLYLYRGIVFALTDQFDDALASFAQMKGNVEKEDMEFLVGVAGRVIHVENDSDYESAFAAPEESE